MRFLSLFATGLLLALLSGAESAERSAPSLLPPSEIGTTWIYEGAGGLQRTETLRSLGSEGEMTLDVEETRNGISERRFSYEARLDQDTWVRVEQGKSEIVLRFPVERGARWTSGGGVVEVISTEETVVVPAGEFPSCVKLRRRDPDREERTFYIAPGVGLVEETSLQDGKEVSVWALVEQRNPREGSTDALAALLSEAQSLVAGGKGTAPVRVGGKIPTPKRLAGEEPHFTDIALRAGVSGTVFVEILIGKDGHVRGVRIVRSVPMLDAAVLRAVRTWRYEPTVVNGEPVAALLAMSFRFED